MAVEIFREPVYRRYFAPVNSYSFVHTVFMIFLAIFLPLIIAYNSTNFWLKENTVYAQPVVAYRYTAIFVFSGTSPAGPVSYYWSSSTVLNQMHSGTLRSVVIRSAEFDDNLDGKPDRLEVGALLALPDGVGIQSVSALLFHDVRVEDMAKYAFDAVTYHSHESALPLRTVVMESDMELRQAWPFVAKGGYRDPYAGDPLLDLDDKYLHASEASIGAILRRSAARNYSLVARPVYTYTEPAAGPTLNTTLVLRIPRVDIRYTPSVSEVLKFAWIQYVAFFVVTAFLLFRLNAFIFRHRLLYAHVVNDVTIGKTM